jgi:DNA-binding response OmpR family regulator
MNVLIAEDEIPLANSLRKSFLEEGHQAYIASNGEDVLRFITQNSFDAIILDWKMPKLTGIEVLKYLRENGNKTPIILLTALSRVSSKIEALELGADDYVTKPFSFEELLARIKAVVRRSKTNGDKLIFEGLSLDLITRKVICESGVEIRLTDKEFELLKYLIENKGSIINKEELCHAVWELNFVPSTNICEATIKNLRKKIEEITGKKIIRNVYGEGYTLIASQNL